MPDFGKMETQFYIDGYSKGYRPLLCDYMRYFYEHFECECECAIVEIGFKRCPICGGLVGKVKEVCPRCNGKGWYEGTGTHWARGEDGEAIPEPEPIQVQCLECNGSGKVKEEKDAHSG